MHVTLRRSAVLASIMAAMLLSADGLAASDPPVDVAAAARSLRDAAGAEPAIARSGPGGAVSFVRMPRGHGIPVDVGATAPAAERAAAFLRAQGRLLGLPDPESTTVLAESGPDETGMEHVRLQRTHLGVPIRAAQVTVHLRGATVVAIHSRAGGKPAVDVAPSISAAAASAIAARVAADEHGAADAVLSDPRLEIFDRSLIDGSPAAARLTWLVEVRAPLVDALLWIDAENGEALFFLNRLYEALDRRIHENNGGSLGALLRSEGDPPTGDEPVDDVYDYSGDTYAYYLAHHGRDSWDGAGAMMVAIVRYPALNAFWFGNYAVFGVIADDTVAHEWTHGVTQSTSDLIYFKQSGAMNESYSDIFGEVVDLSNTAGSDAPQMRWALFEDFVGVRGVRHMYNPNDAFLTPGPGRMTDAAYFACGSDDGYGVHTNSSLGNHGFALMTDGGVYNGHTIIGVGLEKAAKIQYRALTEYLAPSSTYADNYDALLQSCDDLIGTIGIAAADCARIETALDAVEMDFPWPCDCGNGIMDVGEECDDDNLVDGDGCDSNCTSTGCGNGIATAGEACDGGDCCSASCTIEPAGASCADDGNSCTSHTCDAGGACQYAALTGSCDDGDPGTVGDQCNAGVCAGHAPELDAFKCYAASDLDDPPFAPSTVDLADQFGASSDVEIETPRALCNPAALNGGPIDAPAGHLTCFKLKGSAIAKESRPHVQAGDVFGAVSLEIVKPYMLCVPSTKSLVP